MNQASKSQKKLSEKKFYLNLKKIMLLYLVHVKHMVEGEKDVCNVYDSEDSIKKYEPKKRLV